MKCFYLKHTAFQTDLTYTSTHGAFDYTHNTNIFNTTVLVRVAPGLLDSTIEYPSNQLTRSNSYNRMSAKSYVL